MKKCLDCGKKVSKKESKRCAKCFGKFYSGKRNHAWKNGVSLIKKYCKDCGKLLTYYKYEYCVKCHSKGKLNPRYIDGRSMKKNYCISCEKEIDYRKKRCIRCAGIFRKKPKPICIDCNKIISDRRSKRCEYCDYKFRVGKNHHHFKGGTSKYPIKWNEKLRELIRQRDSFKCRVCGVPQIECIRALTVHHIDENKKNLSSKNLISVCMACHRKLHFKKVKLCLKK